MGRWRQLGLQLAALAALVAYGWTIRQATQGHADPVWTALQARGTLRVGADPGFRPFAEERAGQWRGYDVDLANELGRRLGLRVEFVAVSYDALYDELGSHHVDLLAAALPLAPEQGWRARFTGAYLDAGQVLVARADSGVVDEAGLAGRRVGAALGSDGDTLLQQWRQRDPTIGAESRFDTPGDALAALERGALDAVVADAVSALGLTERDPAFRIARSLTFEPLVLAVPGDAYQLQAAINGALDELRRAGFFAELNRRWFASPA